MKVRVMIMASNTARTTDEIEQSNLARRKDELWFAFWLRDLKESIEKKRESYNIDARKLEKALTDIDTIKANHGLNMMSSKDSDWLPLWVIDTVAWAKGYEGYCNACGKRWLGVDLVLAGHTHGGQVFPGHLLTARSHPEGPGLHRRGRTWVYTSRGTGYWGPMLRIGAPAEVTLVRLRAAAPAGPPNPLTPDGPRLTVAAAVSVDDRGAPWTSPRSSTRSKTASPGSRSTGRSATTPARPSPSWR